MSSTNALRTEQDTLLALARRAIAYGVTHQRPPEIDVLALPEVLREPGAAFVTLHLHGELRGCVGSLEARQALALDVAENAFNAAFRDPRFAPLTEPELDAIDIHISVLTPAQPLTVSSEQDLLRQLRPGTDGVIIEEGRRRGTFLPSVWEQLPEPRDFVRQLKRKAGFPEAYWSPNVRVWRYEAISLP